MNDDRDFNIDWNGVNRRQIPSVVRTPFIIIIITVAVAAIVLALDLSLPLGVAGAVPYVALILMGIWYSKRQHIYLLAVLGSALTIVGYFASPSGGVLWVVLTNRGVALLVIWITALLIASRKQFEDKLRLARDNLEIEVADRTKQMKESEARFRAVAQSAQDAIISANKNGLIVQWNNGARQMFGYDETEIVGQPVTVLIPEHFRDDHIKGFERFMVEGERQLGNMSLEVEALRKDGSKFPIELTISEWSIGDEKFVTSIIRNITERRRAGEELLKLSQTVEQSPNMLFITNTEGIIEYANTMFYEVTGYSSHEILGQSPRIIQSGNTPQALYRELWRTIKSGEIWSGEIEDRCKDGSVFWADITIAPIKSKDGVITHYSAIHADISDRKETENKMREAKEQAEVANRSKSDLMANMSHELRTPLNAIIGFSGSMKDETFGPIGNDKYSEYLDDIHFSGEHLLELINDILDVSAIEANALELHEENVNLSQIVDASIRIIKPRADTGQITIISSINQEIPLIFVDERRVKQAFLNLLSNAVKFTQEGGEISLDACLNDDGSVYVSVTDTGIGMDEDEVSMALSAFGQVDSGLDRKHEGTGLGLPLTKGLMELHGGTLEVKSTKGHGTTVTLIFPKERVG
ncbi:MAG: PAS domain S-box protein [Rhodospirillaceae bacterium]|nr:PAS domain S-box protein [Rhodospirillaceae bacterium]MBT5243411.1 PAS domain S-box protein [Rhodospirillaceae bacterium]MBT5563416.1 PAS domain S-box protein [Rhodospirillaceae bacterium]MBT6241091.1 PAS domain S-box protein [Rhodospirillaceae bacterium]MBT7137632.1 PAS domain S-box protein [Rhodospirillaceae bacterium]